MWLLTELPHAAASQRAASTQEQEPELAEYTFCARPDGSAAVACVGRRPKDPLPSAGNIIIENQSISREHAEVRCTAQQPDGAAQQLVVVDKSKFGSFVLKGLAFTLLEGLSSTTSVTPSTMPMGNIGGRWRTPS